MRGRHPALPGKRIRSFEGPIRRFPEQVRIFFRHFHTGNIPGLLLVRPRPAGAAAPVALKCLPFSEASAAGSLFRPDRGGFFLIEGDLIKVFYHDPVAVVTLGINRIGFFPAVRLFSAAGKGPGLPACRDGRDLPDCLLPRDPEIRSRRPLPLLLPAPGFPSCAVPVLL